MDYTYSPFEPNYVFPQFLSGPTVIPDPIPQNQPPGFTVNDPSLPPLGTTFYPVPFQAPAPAQTNSTPGGTWAEAGGGMCKFKFIAPHGFRPVKKRFLKHTLSFPPVVYATSTAPPVAVITPAAVEPEANPTPTPSSLSTSSSATKLNPNAREYYPKKPFFKQSTPKESAQPQQSHAANPNKSWSDQMESHDMSEQEESLSPIHDPLSTSTPVATPPPYEALNSSRRGCESGRGEYAGNIPLWNTF